MITIAKPYLLFIGDTTDYPTAKTAAGIRHWRAADCAGQWRASPASPDLGLPDLDFAAAVAQGARTLVVGVAPVGGRVPEAWVGWLAEALEAGLDLAAGLHQRLGDIEVLRLSAARLGRAIHDIRQPTEAFDVGTGDPRRGKRLLTVGTDCVVGKMYTALAIEREMRARGIDADFRATGQTGIFIAGSGICVDAVISDFVSGATEALSPAAASDDHWDLVEGQGSLFHPSYAGVSLGLLHGAQADAIVLCHDPSRPHIDGFPRYPIPPLDECIAFNLEAGRLTNPAIRCIGVAANTSKMGEAEAAAWLAETADRLALPCVDPVRTGVAALVDAI